MKHQTQDQLRAKDLLIAEAVIKGMIQKDKIKEAIELCEKKHISAERFGELTRIALQ